MTCARARRRTRTAGLLAALVVAALAGAQPSAAAVTEFGLPTSASEPAGITTGPDGNLWAVERNADKIARITPAGAVTEFTLVAGRGPHDIVSAGGLIFFTERAGDRIGRLDPAAADIQASISEFLVAGAGSQPSAIAAGPDGNVWFTEAGAGADQIGRMTPAGIVTEFAVPGAGSRPTGIASGPDGALWFTEAGSQQLGRITTAGAITNEFEVPALGTPASELGPVTAGPDGALWFVDSGIDHVRRATTAGALSTFPAPGGSGLTDIASGPDGALWLTEGRAGKVARMTTSGAVSEFTLPTTGAGPAGIATGPDGALWFTEALASRVGRITTDTTPDALPTGPSGATGATGATGAPGAPGTPGPAGETRVVLVAFQVTPARPRAGRRLKVRFAITGAAAVNLQVKRGRSRARTVARRNVRRAGVGTLAWNGKIGRKAAPRGLYTLTVRATANGRTVSSRLKARLR